jgi:hypothetical protein
MLSGEAASKGVSADFTDFTARQARNQTPLGTTVARGHSAASRNQSLKTLNSRRAAETAEKAFYSFSLLRDLRGLCARLSSVKMLLKKQNFLQCRARRKNFAKKAPLFGFAQQGRTEATELHRRTQISLRTLLLQRLFRSVPIGGFGELSRAVHLWLQLVLLTDGWEAPQVQA